MRLYNVASRCFATLLILKSISWGNSGTSWQGYRSELIDLSRGFGGVKVNFIGGYCRYLALFAPGVSHGDSNKEAENAVSY
jgi:hypothetical protein